MERVQLSIVAGEIPEELSEVRFTVRETSTGASTELVLRVRDAGQLHRRTYLSAVDASVQEYAVLPPTPGAEPPGPMRFALSLHGAGGRQPWPGGQLQTEGRLLDCRPDQSTQVWF